MKSIQRKKLGPEILFGSNLKFLLLNTNCIFSITKRKKEGGEGNFDSQFDFAIIFIFDI